MLNPDAPSTRIVLAIVFVLLAAALVINAVIKDRKAFKRFGELTSSRARRGTMRKWVLQSFALFGGSSVVTIALAAQFIAPMQAAIGDIPWVSSVKGALSSGLGIGIIVGVVVALVGGGTFAIVAARKETEIPSIGDIQALLPRNRKELPYGAWLSINAGVVEELLFRFGLPAVIFGFSGNAPLAVIASVVIFGVLHAYQGLPGIIGTMIIGAILMAIYLASGSILLAIIAHAAFDLRSLVLIPVILFGVQRIPADD